MNICLAIISILGVYCAVDAEPIGDCLTIEPGLLFCTVDPDELPIRASWYDPARCERGELINCDSDPRFVADMTPAEEGYGRFMACPLGWYWQWIDFGWAGSWQCRDHGGDIHPTWGRVYTAEGFVWAWFIVVDFMTKDEPPWAYLLLDWSFIDDQ